VRRALLRSWPALTRFYQLHPWDVDRLTVDELNEYLRRFGAYQREQQNNARRAKRGGGRGRG
jgi:hypothetical protein